MLKTQIKPSIRNLLVRMRGNRWTPEESKELLAMLDEVRKEVKMRTVYKITNPLDKIKNFLSIK